MAEAVDDIKLEDLDRERETETNEKGETSFIDDRPGDESILIIDTSNPVFTRPDDDDPLVPNPRRDAGVIRRHIIHDKKQFLKTELGITVNKGDGPNSTILYDELRTVTGKDGKINGATYKGKKNSNFKKWKDGIFRRQKQKTICERIQGITQKGAHRTSKNSCCIGRKTSRGRHSAICYERHHKKR